MHNKLISSPMCLHAMMTFITKTPQLGVFATIGEPNLLVRIVYLARLTKELEATCNQLHSSNLLGMNLHCSTLLNKQLQ